jgi:lambda family phage portal protein
MFESFLNRFRSVTYVKRYFEVAGTQNRLVTDWLNGNKAIDAAIRQKGRVLRERARNLVTDNALAARYIQLLRQNVIGVEGFTFSNHATDPSGKADVFANTAIQTAWIVFGKAFNFSVSEDIALKDILDIVLSGLVTDGEAFIRLVRGRGKFGFQIQLIDPMLLDETLNRAAGDGGNEIRLGVEVDQWGKAVAYHFRKPSNASRVYDFIPSGEWQVIPASEIIHVYDWQFLDQTRGYTMLAPVMADLWQLQKYEESEIVAARVASCMGGFFTQPTDESPTGQKDPETGTVNLDMGPGMFRMLPGGTSFTAFEPKHPTNAYESFVSTVKHRIASGLGVSYMSLTGDVASANYSSARVGLLEERAFYKDLQRQLIEQVLEPIFSQWLMSALTLGVINLPLGKFDKFCAPHFEPRAFPWVDPVKDGQASLLMVQNGLTTWQQYYAERGLDFDEVMKRRKYEKDYMTTLGLIETAPINKAQVSTDGSKTSDKPAEE